MSNKTLYIPVEIKARELHSKLLVAYWAAILGMTVVIGPKAQLQQRMMESSTGIYFGYGLMDNLERTYRRFRRMGHRIAAFDEEGLVYLRPELYKSYRVSPQTARLADCFFSWGEAQDKIVHESLGDIAIERVLSGSPRIDLLKPEYREVFAGDLQQICSKYGRYILINTAFGPSNHYKGPGFYLESLRGKKMIRSDAELEFHRNRIEYNEKLFRGFLEMVPVLCAEMPEVTVLLRPHPSESLVPWRVLEERHKNLHIIAEGNVIPWMLGADAVIHNGCTTGVEAFLLGKRVIAYKPISSDEYDIPLPNSLSETAVTPEDLMTLLCNDKSTEESCEDKWDILKSHVHRGYPDSSAVMAATINDLELTAERTLYGKIYKAANALKSSLAKVTPSDLVLTSYDNHKCPSLVSDEVAQILTSISNCRKMEITWMVTSVQGGCLIINQEQKYDKVLEKDCF